MGTASTASFAEVETALARMHGISEEVRPRAFRARLQNLQRLGLPFGKKPGRGKKIDYTAEDVFQLAFCLELAQFGFDPSYAVDIIENYWSYSPEEESIYGNLKEALRTIDPDQGKEND